MSDFESLARGLEGNATRFLSGRGLELLDLRQFAPPVARDETLLLCSTVAEGLANSVSDIDLLYLGGGELVGSASVQHDNAGVLDVAFDGDGNEINVQRITIADLEAMAQRMQSTIAAIDMPQELKGLVVELDPRRLQTLHRIRNSVVVTNPDVWRGWCDRLLLARLHEHLCLQGVLGYLGFREDVLGELADGHEESAHWIARTMMAQNLIAAVLHAIGETNTNRKWHLRLLRHNASQIGPERVENLIAFVMQVSAVDSAHLVREIEDVLDPIADHVQASVRSVRRAALAFGHSVRYAKTYRTLRASLRAKAAGGG